MEKYLITHNYIINRWKDGLRTVSHPEYPLPFPFEPPCVDGVFQCMFYWDTFFTNRGMILDGYIEYAKYNTDNLIYLLNKYGCVPNSNSYPGIKHNSQPPYLQYMIRDVYEVTKDKEWLKEAYFALKKEYDFWMTKRMTPIGLNQYLHHPKSDEEKIEFYDYVATRLDLDKNAPREFKIKAGAGFNAQGESGLDFSPRFGFDGEDMVEVDLNSHMFAMEAYLALLAAEFEPKLESYFLSQKDKRRELMNKYLLCEDGLYYDYNFVKNSIQQREMYFTGQFVPFIVGLLNNKDALRHLLSKVEFTFGISSTTPYSSNLEYQAGYPFSFPYDNALAFWALSKVGLEEDLLRVGKKYLEMCSSSYIEHGHLWEVYNAIKPGRAEKKEYPNTEMLGWTAGTYQWIYYYIYEGKKLEY
ncbi:MAG: trehalase family glycosidase [Bacilli bacterium]